MELLGILLLSFVYRKLSGKHIVMPDDNDELVYKDRWISGHSFNIFRIIGGARNCLWVQVKKDTVSIAPHFPFSLLFLPEIWGCEWHFKKSDIIKIEENILGVVVSYKNNEKTKEFRVYPTKKVNSSRQLMPNNPLSATLYFKWSLDENQQNTYYNDDPFIFLPLI
jgi:hypothetical protein